MTSIPLTANPFRGAIQRYVPSGALVFSPVGIFILVPGSMTVVVVAVISNPAASLLPFIGIITLGINSTKRQSCDSAFTIQILDSSSSGSSSITTFLGVKSSMPIFQFICGFLSLS